MTRRAEWIVALLLVSMYLLLFALVVVGAVSVWRWAT